MDAKQVHYETMCEMESSGVARLLAWEHAHQRLAAIPRLLPSDLSASRLDELLTQAPFDEVSGKLCFFVQQVSACAEGSPCRRKVGPGLPSWGGRAPECECKAQRKVCACSQHPRQPRSRCRCPRWNLRNTAPAISYKGCEVYRETLRWEEWDEGSCAFRMGDYIIHAFYLRRTAQPPRDADVATFEAWRDTVTWHQDPHNPTGPRVRLAFCQARKEAPEKSRPGKRPRAVSPPFMRPPPCLPGGQEGTAVGKEEAEISPTSWGAAVEAPSPVQAHNSPETIQQGQTRSAPLGVLSPGARSSEINPGEGFVGGGGQGLAWGTGPLGSLGEGNMQQAPVGTPERPPLEGLSLEPFMSEEWSEWLVEDQDLPLVPGHEETEGTCAALRSSRAPRAAGMLPAEHGLEAQGGKAPEGSKKPLLDRLIDVLKHPKTWRAKSPGNSKRPGRRGLARSPSRDADPAGGLQGSNGFTSRASGRAGSPPRTSQETVAMDKRKDRKGKAKERGKGTGSGQHMVANQHAKVGPQMAELEMKNGVMKPAFLENVEASSLPVLSPNAGTISACSRRDNSGSPGAWSFDEDPCLGVTHGLQALQDLPAASAAGAELCTMAPYFSGSMMQPPAASAAQWPLAAFPESAQAGGLTSLPVGQGAGGPQNAGHGAHLEPSGEECLGGNVAVVQPPDKGYMESFTSHMLEDDIAAPSVDVIMSAAPYELESPSAISPIQERLVQHFLAPRRIGSVAQEVSVDKMASSCLESQNKQEEPLVLDDWELEQFEFELLDTASSPPKDHTPFMGEAIFRGLRDMGLAIQPTRFPGP